MCAMRVKELKKILENVPDDYECTILVEGVDVQTVEVIDETKLVDFSY